MNIPDEAIEAAARELYEEERSASDGFDDWPEWGDAPEVGRGAFCDLARAALKAAAPILYIEAWDDGYEDGLIDGDPAIQSKIERGVARSIPNPGAVDDPAEEPPCEWCGWCRDCTRDPERPVNNGGASA